MKKNTPTINREAKIFEEFFIIGTSRIAKQAG